MPKRSGTDDPDGGGKSRDRQRPGRRRLPADQRRREIIEAAQRIFTRDGLEGARTREIAREAGINPATMFHYFASKEELFEASIVEAWADLVQQADPSTDRFARADVKRRRAVAAAETRHELDVMDDMFPLLAAALFSNRDRGAEFYRKHFRPFLDEQARLVRKGLPDWKERGLDPDLIALQGIATFFFLVADRHYRGDRTDTRTLAKKISDLQLFGILGEKGGAKGPPGDT